MRRAFAALLFAALVGCSTGTVGGSSSGSSSGGAGSASGTTTGGSAGGASGTTSGGSAGSTNGSSSTTTSSSASSGTTSGSGGWSFHPTWSYDGGACEPEPPRSVVDLAMPQTTRTVTVAASDDLQAALDAAQPGDELVLPAGAVFHGSFRLHPKSGAGVIVVRSSEVDQLPPLGSRVAPTHAAHMPRLETTGDVPALSMDDGAGGWRLVGIELGVSAGNTKVHSVVELGDGTQTDAAQLPHDVVLDRCFIHGNDTGDARRGVALNAASVGIVGCDIENFHEQGADSQAAGGWNGPGPFTLVNSYFEGAGETFLMGGADPAVQDLVPSDLAIVHNTFSKRLTWKADDASYAGINYVVKNTVELKNARRVWIEGNVIERSWPMGQVGYAVLFTPRDQSGTAPWSGVQDVTFIHNLVRHAAGAVNLLASDDLAQSVPTARVRVWDSIFTDIGTAQWGQSTKAFQFLHGGAAGATCIDYQHLTSDNAETLAGVGDSAPVADQFTFANNIVGHGTYGFFGSNVGEGNAALNQYFTNWSFSGNVIAGGGSASQYPSGNAFAPSMADVGFVDAANGDYRLSGSSPYLGTATDGRDPGADVAAVMASVE